MATVFLDKKGVILVNFFLRRTTLNCDCYIQTLRSLNAHICQVCITKRCQKCCFSMTKAGHIQVCSSLKPSLNLDGQCSCTHFTVLTLYHESTSEGPNCSSLILVPLSMYCASHFTPLGIILLGITMSAVKGRLKV